MSEPDLINDKRGMQRKLLQGGWLRGERHGDYWTSYKIIKGLPKIARLHIRRYPLPCEHARITIFHMYPPPLPLALSKTHRP